MEAKLKAARNVNVDFGKLKKAAFKSGDRVHHDSFGEGTVSTVRAAGGDLKVSVHFPGKGVRTLLASKAGLKKV